MRDETSSRSNMSSGFPYSSSYDYHDQDDWESSSTYWLMPSCSYKEQCWKFHDFTHVMRILLLFSFLPLPNFFRNQQAKHWQHHFSNKVLLARFFHWKPKNKLLWWVNDNGVIYIYIYIFFIFYLCGLQVSFVENCKKTNTPLCTWVIFSCTNINKKMDSVFVMCFPDAHDGTRPWRGLFHRCWFPISVWCITHDNTQSGLFCFVEQNVCLIYLLNLLLSSYMVIKPLITLVL